MRLILGLLFILLLWFLWKKRSFFTYRNGVKEVVTGDPIKGLEFLRKAAKMGISPNQQVQVAYAELKYGDPNRARAALNLLLLNQKLKDPIKYQVKLMMDILRLQEGELDEARESLDALYEKGFRSTNFYATYGYMAVLTGEKEYYTKINDEAYQYNKDNLVICDNYALSLHMAGDLDGALAVYRELIAKEPKFPEAYYNYACVLTKTGDTGKATEMLRVALEQEFTGVTTIKEQQVRELLHSLEQSNSQEQ
ncbi:MAG: tetratricopeptide repeat protein [Clostridia bacterium]|nr:tetratricopeptide repeat protein [Clostridia bacterium]